MCRVIKASADCMLIVIHCQNLGRLLDIYKGEITLAMGCASHFLWSATFEEKNFASREINVLHGDNM